MSERMRKVNEALRHVLADGVETLADPGLGFVTITAVRASQTSATPRSTSASWAPRSGAGRACGPSIGPMECFSAVLQRSFT